jgi:transcriptional regulator with XRE-family HTH domain
MTQSKALDVNSKMIGVLIRGARLKSGKTLKACAELLGCSPHTISQYEQGRGGVSLPELELLAAFFDVPAGYFWEEGYTVLEEVSDLPSAGALVRLRHKTIGALLREARLQANRSQKECAEVLGVSADTISRYEYGKKPVPFPQLEFLASYLDVPLSSFLDPELTSRRTSSQPGGEAAPSVEATWAALPTHIQDFVRDPDSLPYLEIARSLSRLPEESLRQFAETILSATD